MKIGELFDQLPESKAPALRAIRKKDIRAVTCDPDAADGNSIFVCARTALSDGQYLVHMAYAHGCRVFVVRHDPLLPPDAAVLSSEEPEALLATLATRLAGYPAREMTVFGVCGSAGKTTVILMAEAILAACGRRVGIITPQLVRCADFCLPGTGILPDAPKMQHILGLLHRNGCEIVLAECTSYQLMHHTFAQIPFIATLLVSYDYREIEPGVHRCEQEYREALEALLLAGAPFCFLPAGEMSLRVPENAVRFGAGGNLVAHGVRADKEQGRPGRRFAVSFDGQEYPVFLSVPGDFAVKDALAAAELCLLAGEPPAEIFAAFATLSPIGTLELLGEKNGARIYRDSAFTPLSLSRAIETLRAFTKGKLCVLFGSVGARTYRRRAPLALSASGADLLYLTADDPDTEDPARICAELARAFPQETHYAVIPDRREAVLQAAENLCPGDLLLLAGKGLYPTQKIMGKVLPFDEKALLFEEFALK